MKSPQTQPILSPTSLQHHLGRLVGLPLAIASTACLISCGGGGDTAGTASTGTQASTEATALQATSAERSTGTQTPQAATTAASPQPQWGEPNAVYTDKENPLAAFADTQFAVNDKGDVYVTWLSHHNGQTDVWVRQYNAAESRWLQGEVLVSAPDTSEGRILTTKVTANGNDVVVAWDFGVPHYYTTPHSAHPVVFYSELVSPGRIYYSRRANGEGAWSAAQQVPGVMQRPLGAYSRWTLTPAGPQELALVWYNTDQHYMASFYGLNDKGWGPSQDLLASNGEYKYNAVITARFNRRGSGIVGFWNGSDAQASFYYDRAANRWSSTPLPVHGPTEIDEAGNVYSLDRQWGDSPRLNLGILSAATRQVTTHTLHSGFQNTSVREESLLQTPKGLLLDWIEEVPSTHQTLRRELEVHTSGQAAGPIRNLQTYEPGKTVYAMAMSAYGNAQLAVWRVTCASGDWGCNVLSASVRDPEGQWSAPTELTRPWADTRIALKVNQQGQGTLIQHTSDASQTYEERVFATSLK